MERNSAGQEMIRTPRLIASKTKTANAGSVADNLSATSGNGLLANLLDERGLTRKSQDLVQLGRYLGFLAGRKIPYRRRYLLSVLNGTLEPSKKLTGVILEALAAEVDGGVQGVHLTTPMVCSEKDCLNRFVRNHPSRTRCYICSPVRNGRFVKR